VASIQETGGGKRGLNPEVNLVPFIDLLSVCICFLLISAVWLNVGSLQVKQALGTAADEPPAELLDIEISFVDAYSVVYAVKHKNQTALSLELKATTREELSQALTDNLEATLAKLRGDKPDTPVSELIGSATVTPLKVAKYDSLIAVMDVLRKHEIVNLGVIPKAG
jgi:biopolymer transport protein ExbD